MTNRFCRYLWRVLSQAPSRAQALRQSPKLETTDTMIPSGDAGIQLFVRNKHPAARKHRRTRSCCSCMAHLSAETAFDLPIEGVSMMDLIAAAATMSISSTSGLRRSTRLPNEPAAGANKPIVSTKSRARSGVAVDYILRKRKVSKINVMAGRGYLNCRIVHQ